MLKRGSNPSEEARTIVPHVRVRAAEAKEESCTVNPTGRQRPSEDGKKLTSRGDTSVGEVPTHLVGMRSKMARKGSEMNTTEVGRTLESGLERGEKEMREEVGRAMARVLRDEDDDQELPVQRRRCDCRPCSETLSRTEQARKRGRGLS